MVRDNGGDARVRGDELLPEAVAVLALADGRAALVSGVALGNLFGGEAEVVETGLCGDLDALAAGGLEERNDLRGGQVDNVKLQVRGGVSQGQDLLDGAGLEGRRARVEEGLVGGGLAVGGVDVGSTLVRDHFGVEHEGRGGVLEGLHGESDVLGVDGGELIDL